MSNIDRRTLLKLAGLIGVTAAMPFSFARAADNPLVVGFIYVGARDDFGYNQAHAEAAAIIKTLPNVVVVEEENVPETVAVQKSMEAMIRQDGATLIFPTSFGYFDPHVIKMAERFPDVHFAHCGGLWTEGVHPTNAGSFFGYIDEGQYLNGVVAGFASKTKKLGFIAAKPVPQVLRNINAFTRGARSVNPEVTTSVIWTSGWSDPSKESEAAEALIDDGADVLTGHVDSPINYVQVAEERGVYSVGYHADASKFAPEGWLVGAVWNWGPMMVDIVESIEDGTWEPEHLRGDLLTEATMLSDFGSAVSDETIAEVEDRRKLIMDEEFQVWAGPIIAQDGTVLVEEGDTMTLEETEKMDFLVEGVEGRLP